METKTNQGCLTDLFGCLVIQLFVIQHFSNWQRDLLQINYVKSEEEDCGNATEQDSKVFSPSFGGSC